jgi:hypothetical protein
MEAAAILENGGRPPLLRFSNLACVFTFVYQISSKSGHIWPIYSLNAIFKMAAAAILENGRRPPLLRFLNSAGVF